MRITSEKLQVHSSDNISASVKTAKPVSVKKHKEKKLLAKSKCNQARFRRCCCFPPSPPLPSYTLNTSLNQQTPPPHPPLLHIVVFVIKTTTTSEHSLSLCPSYTLLGQHSLVHWPTKPIYEQVRCDTKLQCMYCMLFPFFLNSIYFILLMG